MDELKRGLVIKSIASFFYIEYDGKVIQCRASTKLKKNKMKILPGDDVLFELDNLYIKEVLPRKNTLIRPQITNVGNAILVFSLVEPNMNFGLLDRMLMVMEFNNLNSIILITKRDLTSKEEFEKLNEKLDYYKSIGYEIIFNDEINNQDEFSKFLKQDEKYVLTGQSGVGKSTFLNKMDSTLHLETQEISKVLGRGKHTTRETTFFKMKTNYLIDTPGFSSLDLQLTKEQIRDNFIDFFELAKGCKFQGCYHLKEPKCSVKEKYESNEILSTRYENYKKLMGEE